VFIDNRQIDKNLRAALTEFLPDFHTKRIAPANDASIKLKEESRLILEQASGNDPQPNASIIEPKRRKMRHSDIELEQAKKELLSEEMRTYSEQLDSIIPVLHKAFREGVEKFRQAVENATNDDAIDPCDEARHLMTIVKEGSGLMNKETAQLLAKCILGVCSRYLQEKQFYTE
jgi:hypothetical protein